jgi:small-conductance mechanosensitive channel
MKKIAMYHGISMLLYLFLVFTVLLLGRNIIITITDTFVFIVFLLFIILGMVLVTFMNQEARDELPPDTPKWQYFWHKRFIIIISIGLHLFTLLAHFLSYQVTAQTYLPQILFGINGILTLAVILKEVFFPKKWNRFMFEVAINTTTFVLFALTMYFVISPF